MSLHVHMYVCELMFMQVCEHLDPQHNPASGFCGFWGGDQWNFGVEYYWSKEWHNLTNIGMIFHGDEVETLIFLKNIFIYLFVCFMNMSIL